MNYKIWFCEFEYFILKFCDDVINYLARTRKTTKRHEKTMKKEQKTTKKTIKHAKKSRKKVTTRIETKKMT